MLEAIIVFTLLALVTVWVLTRRTGLIKPFAKEPGVVIELPA